MERWKKWHPWVCPKTAEAKDRSMGPLGELWIFYSTVNVFFSCDFNIFSSFIIRIHCIIHNLQNMLIDCLCQQKPISKVKGSQNLYMDF